MTWCNNISVIHQYSISAKTPDMTERIFAFIHHGEDSCVGNEHTSDQKQRVEYAIMAMEELPEHHNLMYYYTMRR